MGRPGKIWRKLLTRLGVPSRAAPERPPAAATFSQPAVAYSSVAASLLADVPIFIPTFNNPTYLRGMLAQLSAKGLCNIIVVDNASTSAAMKSYLKAISDRVTLVRLSKNLGPHAIVGTEVNFHHLPQLFCITDPDLELNPQLPNDFLVELAGLTERFEIGKAGFALDISDPEAMRDDTFVIEKKPLKIWEWESRFWRDKVRVGFTDGGDPIFRARIDTTFALYNKKHFRFEDFNAAVRVGGRYTCRHLPWYRETRLPEDEEKYYRRTQRFSNYLGRR